MTVSLQSLSEFIEKEQEWLIPGWIPTGQITVLAADGGVGKTSIWTHLAASVSAGTRTIFDPTNFQREAGRVCFFSAEDSIESVLLPKLKKAGANMNNIVTTGDGDTLRRLKFGSQELAEVIRNQRPALCVFDPWQGFLPPLVNMGARNQVRDCLSPFVSLGEETQTAFLIVAHSNKRQKASGRDRISDSADLWDIARSVLMAGYTEDRGTRYLSNEKNNYSSLQQTVLFRFDNSGQIERIGSSWKRDADFQNERFIQNSGPLRADCKAWLLDELSKHSGELDASDIDVRATAAGYTARTLRRAKEELKQEQAIAFVPHGSARLGTRKWGVKLKDFQPTIEPTPFDI